MTEGAAQHILPLGEMKKGAVRMSVNEAIPGDAVAFQKGAHHLGTLSPH
jgi:hypothetical protein